MTDPFQTHPELRDLIVAPDHSDYRGFEPEEVRRLLADRGVPSDWIDSRSDREADRRQCLEGRPAGDLWVFAYGSLMWDPGLLFKEVRHAHAPHHARAFIMRDTSGARGTPEAPGVMAALDQGTGCHGLAFCIDAEKVEHETEILWRRERLGPSYRPAFIPLETAAGALEALAFLADHDTDFIEADMNWEDQVRFCATGKGFAGTSLDYVENLARQFDALGIEDRALLALRDAARRYLAA